MDAIKHKLQILVEKARVYGLNDPRVLGLIALGLVAFSVMWSGVGIVQKNYTLQQKVSVLEEQIQVIEISNRNMALQNEYFKTPEYAELRARRVNGKAAPGERVYLIADEVAQAALKTPATATDTMILQPDQVQKPRYQENFEAWIQFFFGG